MDGGVEVRDGNDPATRWRTAAADASQVHGPVLVVDDDGAVRAAFVRVLRKGGFAAVTAGSAAEAMQAIGQVPPVAVVTDVRMPEGSGLALLEQLRERGDMRALPVLVITGYADADAERAAGRAGNEIFLRKPIRPVDLIRRLRSLLAGDAGEPVAM